MRFEHKISVYTTHVVSVSNSTITFSIGCVFRVLYWTISVCWLPHRSQYNPEKINTHRQLTQNQMEQQRVTRGNEKKCLIDLWHCDAGMPSSPCMLHKHCWCFSWNISDFPLTFDAFCHFVKSYSLLHQLLHLLHNFYRKTNHRAKPCFEPSKRVLDLSWNQYICNIVN